MKHSTCPNCGHQLSRTWTEKEEAYLKANYATTDNRELAKALGRTYRAIKQKAFMLDLKKEERWSKK